MNIGYLDERNERTKQFLTNEKKNERNAHITERKRQRAGDGTNKMEFIYMTSCKCRKKEIKRKRYHLLTPVYVIKNV
jgi:hypothetical protein